MTDYRNFTLSEEVQALVIPIAPMGQYPDLPMGIIPCLTDYIVSHLSLPSTISVAPLMPYGFTTPYKGFGPQLGMRKNSFPSFVKDMLLNAHASGIQRVIFLAPLSEDAQLIKSAYKRYTVKLPGLICTTIVWHELKVVQKALHLRFQQLEELWRSEALVALLAHECTGYALPEKRGPLLTKKEVQSWYKRGMDPEKLQKLLREGTLSAWQGVTHHPSQEAILPLLTQTIEKTIQNFMENA